MNPVTVLQLLLLQSELWAITIRQYNQAQLLLVSVQFLRVCDCCSRVNECNSGVQDCSLAMFVLCATLT